MKKLAKRIRRFLWGGGGGAFSDELSNAFWSKIGEYRTGLYTFVKTRHQRNDEEIELQKRLENPLYLERFGYKVYSQNDEDGIIAEIFNRIETTNKIFVEFGVQDGLESNCHFLLQKGWQGVWIEGSKDSAQQIIKLFAKPIGKGQLEVINAFITKDNINQLIKEQGHYEGEIDLLSIDIDGNDYWVWDSITVIQPRVVVIEYNGKFPPTHEWIMEYDADHIWLGDDEQGASLKSLELLGDKLGYQLVGTNVVGANAFFVRNDLAKDHFVKPATAELLYNPTRWTMQYVSGHPAKKYIG